jgi:hypothetical protein
MCFIPFKNIVHMQNYAYIYIHTDMYVCPFQSQISLIYLAIYVEPLSPAEIPSAHGSTCLSLSSETNVLAIYVEPLPSLMLLRNVHKRSQMLVSQLRLRHVILPSFAQNVHKRWFHNSDSDMSSCSPSLDAVTKEELLPISEQQC